MSQGDLFQSPGEFIKAALQERGWTQADLALILNRPIPAVNEIIQAKRALTPEMAVALGATFGTNAEIWMNREAAYRLSLVDEVSSEIQRRVKLFDLAPVKDMEKRGWIAASNSVDKLERELCRFFNVASLNEEPQINASARRTFRTASLTASQRAWCFRGAQIAKTIDAKRFTESGLEDGMDEIRRLADFPEKVRHVSRVLSEIGIRLVVIEPLPRSRIDGAAIWIGDDAPVIVLSVRFDKIDGFWHTLAHELIHIRYRDAQSVDSDIVGEAKQENTIDIEVRADKEAADFLIPSSKLESFILRVRPFYSKTRINQFAQRMHVHPGIVNGQLQHRKEITHGTNREMSAKIREILTASATTDGWGKTIPRL
jgi:HTH-type transcriptional regulator / antitoxin HigA